MKLVKIGVALFLAFVCFSFTQAQTADDIVNKYIDAMGGKDKLSQVKSVYMENTSSAMGNEGPSTINLVTGVGFKMVSDFNGQSIIIAVTDKGGWQVNPFSGASSPTAMPDDMLKQSKGRLDPFGPLYNYAAKGNKIELQGKDGNAYKLKVTNADSVETTLYVDATTYFITKSVSSAQMMGQTMEVITTYSNYKKVDPVGVYFPYSYEISYGGQFTVTTTVNKIEVNKTIDPSIFVMPKS
jgi:outer membrane lipoprotein-sorting protein